MASPRITLFGMDYVLRRPGVRALVKVVLLKHLLVSWKRRRWLGIVYSNVFFGFWFLLLTASFVDMEAKWFGVVVVVVPYVLAQAQASLMSKAIVDIVVEKESKMKAVQEINGLPTLAYWLSWFLYFMLYAAFSTGFWLLILKLLSPFFAASDVLLLALLWIGSYAQLFMAMCCLSVLCSRTVLASLLASAAQIICTVGSASTLTVSLLSGHPPECWVRCLLLAAPLGGFMDNVASTMWLESRGQGGLRVETLFMEPPIAAVVPLGVSLGAIGGGVLVYAAVAWWLDQVWKGEYGVSRGCCFCLRRGRGARAPPLAPADIAERGGAADGESRQVAVDVQDLVKAFGQKRAVDGLNLEVFGGEIFALLGHNGAGKTTLLNCLVGLVPPSSGSAFVAGFSTTEEVSEVRRCVAVCPQDSPLYAELTLEQHLIFFAGLRGIELGEDGVLRVLQALGLLEKRLAASATLSGGQKRRLWVATALVADAPVTILDEPTSGMDPFARRELWAVLTQRRSEGHCIVFTTHYLDEADVLADRKAILARGRVRAVGTSRELKRRFGVGYILHVEASAGGFDPLRALVRGHIRSAAESPASASRDGAARLEFHLPLSEIQAVGALVEDLEAQKASLGVRDYGLQMTSLEDVFMRIGRQDDEASSPQGGADPSPPLPDVELSTGAPRAPTPAEPRPTAAALLQGDAAGRGVRSGWPVLRGIALLVRLRIELLVRNWPRALRQVVLPPCLIWLFLRDCHNPVVTVVYMPLAFVPLALGFADVVFRDVQSKCKFVTVSQGLPSVSYWVGSCIADLLIALPSSLASALVLSKTIQGWMPESMHHLVIAECVLASPMVLIPFAYNVSRYFRHTESIMKFIPFAFAIGSSLPALIITAYLFSSRVWVRTLCMAAHMVMSLANPLYGLPGMILTGVIRPDVNVASVPVHIAVAPLYLSPICAAAQWCMLLSARRRGRGRPEPGEEAAEPTYGDPDVLGEEARVRRRCADTSAEDDGAPDAVACLGLRHSYAAKAGPVRAVRGVSLGARQGECFGLLGPNGAGKTTTLGLLSGELWPATGGAVYVRGRSVDEAGGFERLLFGSFGLCPQVDPLWEELPGRQHLLFYGRLKGVPRGQLDRVVETLLGELGLAGADAAKRVREYSGGMRRKLSVGIALIGQPSLLLLDEPSAAVDAAAKRYLWGLIKRRGPSQTVLLTTHSMEEAEALCDRIAIQVLGTIRCLGSPVHLRSGLGYRLEVFLRPAVTDGEEEVVVARLVEFVQQRIALEAQLVECHRGRCLFQLPRFAPVSDIAPDPPGARSLAAVISEVSAARQHLGVEEYSVSQPSLEQVFLRAGHEQEREQQGPVP